MTVDIGYMPTIFGGKITPNDSLKRNKCLLSQPFDFFFIHHIIQPCFLPHPITHKMRLDMACQSYINFRGNIV